MQDKNESAIHELAATGRFWMQARVRCNGTKDYYQISAPRITRQLMGAPLSVGNCNAATMTVSILTKDVIPNGSRLAPMVRLCDSTGEYQTPWIGFGDYYVNQRDTSYDGMVTLECYDAMLLANAAYPVSAGPQWPRPMVDVVSEIAQKMGVGIDPRTKIKTGADYVVQDPTGKTMTQVLGYIGACHGGNWIISDAGKLRLVPLATAPDQTYYIVDEDRNRIKLFATSGPNTMFKPYLLTYKEAQTNPALPEPSGSLPGGGTAASAVPDLVNVPVICGELTTGPKLTVTGVSLGGGDSTVYTAGDATGFMLKIEGNPYATQGICDDLYAAYAGLVYQPYTATKCLFDPTAELGDQCVIGDLLCGVICAQSMVLDLNFRSDISAPNSEELNAEYPYPSELEQLKQTTQQLTQSIQDTADNLSGKVDDADLAAEITRAGDAETALGERIGTEETRAQTAESALGTQISGEQSRALAAEQENSARITALTELLNSMELRLKALENQEGGT